MTRFELSLNPQYVSNWGIWEALRELAQNCYDRSFEFHECEHNIHYNSFDQTMMFSNENTMLSTSTLLLGVTSKSNNDKTIGQYGEGYKLSLLVLTRMGIRVSILNGLQVWTPKIIKSKRYDSEILVIDVEKSKVKHNSLTFMLQGITPKMYSDFFLKNINMDYPKDTITTKFGNIILDNSVAGNIYCGGLFVQHCEDNCKYAYDIPPAYLKLDRDRQKVTSFNLFWITSQMWDSVTDIKYKSHITDMIKNKNNDISNIEYFSPGRTDQLYKDICDLSYENFLSTYGIHAVPVSNSEDAELIKTKFKNFVPIVVSKVEYVYITGSTDYKDYRNNMDNSGELCPYDMLNNFFNTYCDYMGEHMTKSFNALIAESKRWVVG